MRGAATPPRLPTYIYIYIYVGVDQTSYLPCRQFHGPSAPRGHYPPPHAPRRLLLHFCCHFSGRLGFLSGACRTAALACVSSSREEGGNRWRKAAQQQPRRGTNGCGTPAAVAASLYVCGHLCPQKYFAALTAFAREGSHFFGGCPRTLPFPRLDIGVDSTSDDRRTNMG